ncbi:DUF5107 domain-containing protein [Kutzneria albida]|uniref:Tetratricopeptide repeat-containing protein n=1 Tax=Kutzneria albida DSM 43870 TaxID=1449976 RepID=W5W2T9_9PSEU|nr:DUF5107 domain-containing protein [Kutzneria albida]AHH95508.1 tetratricopeptide repeat-containing protein [Kutzneria albida DSM 43870]
MTTTLTATELVLPVAAVGAENPLPPLHNLNETHHVRNLDELPAELADNIGYGRLGSVLPYRLQDGYGRERADTPTRVVVLENSQLRATVLVELGGRLHSLWDKQTGRELLFRNPVVQPANLALRNAWFAGGVEWNLGSTGHTTLTCDPMHAAELTAPDGTPMLRLWEWERTRNLVYQLDFWLPVDSAFLFVAVRVRNPNQHEVPAYWWSNIAVEQSPGTRVLAPAEQAWHFGYGQRLDLIPVPVHNGFDNTYSMRHADAADCFFEIPAEQRPWIAALDETGTGLVQTSTDRLRGRKLFVWGENRGGRRWQDWLAPEGSGHGYLEIQAGLARTQLEHLRMPALAEWDWLEAYGAVQADPAAVHGADWAVARGAVESALGSALPKSTVDDRLTQWRTVADAEPRRLIGTGSGWGALELVRSGRSQLPGTPFSVDTLGVQQDPWLALLDGAMPVGDPLDPPAATLVGPHWLALLDKAGQSWSAAYHQGVARWHAGDLRGAAQSWRRSLELAASPWAMRNLAVVEPERAADLLRQAVRLAPGVAALAVEALQALLAADRAQEAAQVLELLPEDIRGVGRIRLAEARVLHALGEHEAARSVLDNGFELADIREGSTVLAQTWRLINPDLPLPAHHDFSMTGE